MPCRPRGSNGPAALRRQKYLLQAVHVTSPRRPEKVLHKTTVANGIHRLPVTLRYESSLCASDLLPGVDEAEMQKTGNPLVRITEPLPEDERCPLRRCQRLQKLARPLAPRRLAARLLIPGWDQGPMPLETKGWHCVPGVCTPTVPS